MINKKKFWWSALVVVVLGAVLYFYFFMWSNDTTNPVTMPVISQGGSLPTPKIMASTSISVLSPPVSPVSPVSPITGDLTQAVADPEAMEAIINTALRLQELGEHEQALEQIDRVIDQDPNNFIALNIRGSVQTSLGNYDEALADYSKTIELEPLFPFAYYNRGRVYRLMEEYDQALPDLERAAELSPAEFGYRAYGNIGLIFHQQGDYDRAVEAFAKSIEGNFEDKADIYYFRGETYLAMGNIDAAIADYKSAIDRFPSYGDAYMELGYALLLTEAFQAATEALNQAVAITPDDPAPYLYLMLGYLAAGEVEQAVVTAERASDLINDQNTDNISITLSRTSDLLGDIEASDPVLEKTIAEIRSMLPQVP